MQIIGWVSQSASRHWQILRSGDKNQVLIFPVALRDQIIDELSEINQTYEKYYHFMNAQYDKSLNNPRWESEFDETSLRCSFNDAAYLLQHQESTRYIIERIKALLLGTPFRLFETTRGFEIRAGSS